jgi:multicomponent Na+:H+ antiporter subunit C
MTPATSLVQLFAERYEYWMTAALLITGLYGLLTKRNLVKKLIGLNILQSAIILFFVSLAVKPGGQVPILPHHGVHSGAVYMSPLPHVLMLTAIVVMVSTSGVAFALLILIYRRYGTLDEAVLLGRRR